MTDRGVSEVLGFVLVFALVTGTIGVVYATGITGLHDAQHAEKVNNVERAFDVLADGLEDIHRTGTPSRATEVKLAGGSLRTGEPVSFRIRAENSSDPMHNATFRALVEPIIYEDDGGSTLVYSGGAVIRSESAGGVMLSGPPWVNRSDRSVVPLVETYGKSGGISGEGTVLIVGELATRSPGTPFEVEGGATAEVNVTVTSSRVEVWKRYFEEEGFKDIDSHPDHNNVTYQFETDSIYVPKTGVDVSFNR